MICGKHLLSQIGETVAICKREPHDDEEWHTSEGIFVDHEREFIAVQWKTLARRIEGET